MPNSTPQPPLNSTPLRQPPKTVGALTPIRRRRKHKNQALALLKQIKMKINDGQEHATVYINSAILSLALYSNSNRTEMERVTKVLNKT